MFEYLTNHNINLDSRPSDFKNVDVVGFNSTSDWNAMFVNRGMGHTGESIASGCYQDGFTSDYN
jgi:hypothetical protein